MLVADLFEVVDKTFEGNKLKALVHINAGNRLFEGHFPNNPVAPGVMQVQLVKELVELHFDRAIELLSMSRCKFLAILNPVKTPEIEVELEITEEQEEIKVKALGRAGEEIFFKFFASYK